MSEITWKPENPPQKIENIKTTTLLQEFAKTLIKNPGTWYRLRLENYHPDVLTINPEHILETRLAAYLPSDRGGAHVEVVATDKAKGIYHVRMLAGITGKAQR